MSCLTALRTSKRAALLLCFAVCAFPVDPALTIYNQEFAVVHESLPLELQAGSNAVQFTGATAHVEPESVILRDAAGKRKITILEQNYRADVLSQDVLLNLYEGKTIEFLAGIREDGSPRIIRGKIIRSGYSPQLQGRSHQASPWLVPNAGNGQPIIEVDGKLQFFLPGQPIFPDLGADTILKPSLNWNILSGEAARFEAELSYVTSGLTWAADYNLIAPASGDSLDMIGWVTLQNQSGKQFDHARIKLMAGDVSKLAPGNSFASSDGTHLGAGQAVLAAAPAVTERTFDDYHLYSLPTPTTLRDRETKQVQFMQNSHISSRRLYVYDGIKLEGNQSGYSDVRQMPQYGTESNPHVWVMCEFKNSESNQLGMPLPQGRLRFYRRTEDGQLEFTGENEIGHTAKDETVRVYTGNAFDISGERKRTDYEVKNNIFPHGSADESFEIALRNHKREAVTVHVVEHLYRWHKWTITKESDPHTQQDSRTIEYALALQPDQSKVVTYTVHYAW